MSDDALMAQLDALIAEDTDGLLVLPTKPQPLTNIDRLVKAFQEVNAFVETHGREPSPDTLDIAERKLGARLVGIRASAEKTAELQQYDTHDLLTITEAPTSLEQILTDDLDLLGDTSGLFDVSGLPVRKKPDEGTRALRVKAEDFASFAELFADKHRGLGEGTWKLSPFTGESSIIDGRFFLINGLMCFVADVLEPDTEHGENKPRLRVIFENGTQSSMYRESLANRLYETGGQALTRTTVTADEIGDADVESGYIYVLRSLSEHPEIRSLHDLYKIGFSRGPVEKRIAGAAKSATYLMAPVEIVATYRAYNLRPSALEHLLHRLFAAVRLDASVVDMVGDSVSATEWFLVPLPVIDRAIELIISGEIVRYTYDPRLQELVEQSA